MKLQSGNVPTLHIYATAQSKGVMRCGTVYVVVRRLIEIAAAREISS